MLTYEECLEYSPFLSNLQRKGKLAPSRLKTLYESAKSPKPPREPDPWECCGSSCKPCVKELWRQELKCWIECHPDGSPDKEDEYEEKSATHDLGERQRKPEEGASSTTATKSAASRRRGWGSEPTDF